MKAFEVSITTWNNMRIIVSADTPGKAKSAQFLAAFEAGYQIPFTNFRARRAPEFDNLANQKTGWLGWQDKGEAWGCLSPRA